MSDPPDELSLKLREVNGLIGLPRGVQDLTIIASQQVPESGDGEKTWELEVFLSPHAHHLLRLLRVSGRMLAEIQLLCLSQVDASICRRHALDARGL